LFNNENRIFNIASENEFLELSLSIFNYQAVQNPVYSQWIQLLKIRPASVTALAQIPFMPIEFFKKHEVISSQIDQNTIKFTSSSTTSQTPSTHFVTDISVYEKSFLTGFELFYKSPSNYCILALLPNYLQRSGSSLVYMCDKLIKASKHVYSGVFLV
jgi:hypothetical protein